MLTAELQASRMMPLCILFLVLLSEICQVSAVDKTFSITQDNGVITAEVGQTVTLKCFCLDNVVTFLFWYQQSLGSKPVAISTWMRHSTEVSISPVYKERFQVQAESEGGINHLVISHTHLSDSATYYCGILEFNAVEFGKGVFLHVKASLSNIQAVIRQPASELLRLGDSLNLTCTAHSEKCSGERSLYWFRHGAAQPAVLYPSTGHCVNDVESHDESCTFSLPMESVNPSDAGVYYCALAACGEIVFGNGTKVEIEDDSTKLTHLAYCLSVVLAACMILILVLAFILCKLRRSKASHALSEDADDLHYAALSLKRTSERQGQENSLDTACVYARVKGRKE